MILGGFVQVPKKYDIHNLHRDPLACCLLWYYYQKANYKPVTILIGKSAVKLKPGQLVTGRRVLAKEMDVSEGKIRYANKRLAESGIISIQATKKFSIISLTDWPFDEDGNHMNYPPTTLGVPTGFQETPTEVDLEVRRENKKDLLNVQSRRIALISDDFIPPTAEEVYLYACENEYEHLPLDRFMAYYGKIDWQYNGFRVNWRKCVMAWLDKGFYE